MRPQIAPPVEGDTRVRATVAYNGAAFHGFAGNPGVATVSGALAGAIGQILGRTPVLACAGRTDAGVHGWGQVISFDTRSDVDVVRLQHSLNRMLGPDIVIRDLDAGWDDFDARFSARSRTYRYRILNRSFPDPFLHRTTWHLARPLDVEAMNEAGQALVGEHDFTSFCRRKFVHVNGVEVEADLTRRIFSTECHSLDDDIVELMMTARAFCHQMVRAITGTLVEIGLGKRSGDTIAAIIEARDRRAAGILAPPHGLTLWSVQY